MDQSTEPLSLGSMSTLAAEWFSSALPNITAAAVILVVGYLVAVWVGRTTTKLTARSHRVDAILQPVIGSVVRYTIMIVVLVVALSQLGVQTASLLAVLGAAGLAIGLALQGTLSNIAAGMMLLWLRPFGINDYIECSAVTGTVKVLGLFATEFRTFEGIYTFVPNSLLWNSTITNYTRNPRRMVRVPVGVGYGDDPNKARDVLVAMARDDSRILDDPEPVAFVSELGASAVVVELRAWAATPDYVQTLRDLTMRAKLEIDKAGLEIPFPQRVLHMVPAPPVEPAA